MRASFATGAHSTEKWGFSASARRNHDRASAPWPRQRSIMPRWKYLSASRVPEPEREAGVVQRLAARPVACERPRRARRRRRRSGGTGIPGARARVHAEARTPWSTSKRAMSRSFRTPFAASSRSMTPISAYCALRGRLVPDRVVEVAEQADVLRQRNPVDRCLLVPRSPRRGGRVRTCACAIPSSANAIPGEELERLPHLQHGRLRPCPSRDRAARAGRASTRPASRSPTAALTASCIACHGGARLPDQLAGVRDACVGRDARA